MVVFMVKLMVENKSVLKTDGSFHVLHDIHSSSYKAAKCIHRGMLDLRLPAKSFVTPRGDTDDPALP